MSTTIPLLRRGCLFLSFGLGFGPALATAAAPVARWMGQDGKDYVGGEPGPAPNGYQDLHVALGGLPAGRHLVEVELRGHGHGAWNNRDAGKSAIRIVPGSRPGNWHLFFEPYQREVGREFEIKWKLDDGRAGNLIFAGGKGDPNLRTPGLGVAAQWDDSVGGRQGGIDRTGPELGVGPDGLVDAHLLLARLSPKAEVKEVLITVPAVPRLNWRSGLNPTGSRGAEFVRQVDDPTRGDLFFSPTSDLQAKQALQVQVTYGDDRTDTVDLTVGKLPTPRNVGRPQVIDLAESVARGRWLGQTAAADAPDRGEVRVEVDGLPPERKIVAAVLSDGVLSTWRWRRDEGIEFDAGPDPAHLRLARTSTRRLELGFIPTRDESTAMLTLRLRDDRGREEVVRFPGGPVDFARLAPPLPTGTMRAKPGQDLQTLVDRAGTIELAPGEYRLDRPLILPRAVRIVGRGATLRFSQAGGKPWTTAIKIREGGTTLEGFAVRFAGPIRWDREVQYGPAVVGTTDDRDGRSDDACHQVALVGLDLEAPPAASDWEEAVPLVRFRTARSGRVERCRLKGGTVRLGGGPWRVVANESLGTVPRTYCHEVFAVHYAHDLVLTQNRAHSIAPAGNTWRFLVLTQRGAFDRVTENIVDGRIGPRQDDAHPHHNSPEVILTEAYRLHYEGKPAAVSPDGRILAIFAPQGGPAATGDAVAILAGSQAGQWRTIAQPLGPQTYLLNEPIAPDTAAVSLATGFVNETFADNTIDCRGSAIAANLVLAGNMFGVRVTGNRLIGGGEALRLHAAPTESPVHWGWSHAPFLGALVANNLIEDPAGGGSFGLGVDHGPMIRANRGRVYMSLDFRGNTVRWTDRAAAASASRPRLSIGFAPALDPAELVVTESDTQLEGGPAEAIWVNAAQINGSLLRNVPLPPRP